MIILGLTGSLAMGKSTVAALFRKKGIPVQSADEAVHELYKGEAVEVLKPVFPAAIMDGKVDHARLSKLLTSKEEWKKLESIVHPLVYKKREEFLKKMRGYGAHLIVLDIPLLFETGLQNTCDAVIVVSAAHEVQKARALSRPGMSLEKLESILSRQMPDAEKKMRAHFVINTESSIGATERQVDAIIRLYAGR
jgi:dephospho-CoA kinase